MTKIAIISQAEQGVLIDVSGCTMLTEAKEYLSSTLQVSSQFWEGLTVELNLGGLAMTPKEVSELIVLLACLGVAPRLIYSDNPITRAGLLENGIKLGLGTPKGLPILPSSGKKSTSKITTGALAGQLSSTAEHTTGHSTGAKDKTEQKATQKIAKKAEKDTQLLGQETNEPTVDELETEHFTTHDYLTSMPTKLVERNSAVMYLKQTLRSGQAVSHSGHLVIVGDVNPGAEVISEGDITVWGALRGIAHAGIGGNTSAEIRALRFDPIQLRIAHAIARSPDRNKGNASLTSGPEVARVVDGKIRIIVSDPE